jgi:hypothetical protein
MAGLTSKEKVMIGKVLDTVKLWWNAVPGSIEEEKYRDVIVELIGVVKDESEK